MYAVFLQAPSWQAIRKVLSGRIAPLGLVFHFIHLINDVMDELSVINIFDNLSLKVKMRNRVISPAGISTEPPLSKHETTDSIHCFRVHS